MSAQNPLCCSNLRELERREETAKREFVRAPALDPELLSEKCLNSHHDLGLFTIFF